MFSSMRKFEEERTNFRLSSIVVGVGEKVLGVGGKISAVLKCAGMRQFTIHAAVRHRCAVRVGLFLATEFLGRGLKLEYLTLEAEWAAPRWADH